MSMALNSRDHIDDGSSFQESRPSPIPYVRMEHIAADTSGGRSHQPRDLLDFSVITHCHAYILYPHS
jgi:hypothetical protein